MLQTSEFTNLQEQLATHPETSSMINNTNGTVLQVLTSFLLLVHLVFVRENRKLKNGTPLFEETM